MRIPTDVSLSAWIRQLQEDDKLYKFYKTDEWKDLRADVLAEQHNECELCGARGEYSRASVVHHVIEVKDRPDLALSRTYIDSQGRVRVQLMALCFDCHNKVHKRFGNTPSRPQLNEERY